jgi:hypothetical protein
MMAPDDARLERAVRRMVRLMAVLALAGMLAAFWWRGWKWGAGFAFGALISWLNFRWLKQLTDALGGKRLRRASAIFLALRYLVLGGAAYVILRYSSISFPALLTGLFVSIAAVILEVLFELVYERT